MAGTLLDARDTMMIIIGMVLILMIVRVYWRR